MIEKQEKEKTLSGISVVEMAVADVGVEAITYVPGYPINQIAFALNAEISVNEKVAMEIALGASATGMRSMVIVKQVGMNLLADPLVISATHTIGSGLVVLAGDDIGPKGSQAEMDSRYYGLLAELPVLDPGDPASLYRSIIEAYRLSEIIKAPVIVRITARLLSTSGKGNDSIPSDRTIFKPARTKLDPTIWKLTARGRYQRHHLETMKLAQEAVETSPLNRIRISAKTGSKTGIIASGYPAVLAEDGNLEASILVLGYTNPLPWKIIKSFIEAQDLVLVAEEPEPVIESQLRMSGKIKGRLTGHLPFGKLEISDLKDAISNLKQPMDETSANKTYENAESRGFKSICPGCPFENLFKALSKIDVPVAGDAGCSILAARPPFESVDMVYGLGSAIGVASGFKEKGIAVIGDFAFAHTGFQGLINAVWQGHELLVVLLLNDVAAMTGGQNVPDLTALLKSLVPVYSLQFPASEEEIVDVLGKELKMQGISAIVVKGCCIKYKNINSESNK